MRHVNKSNFSAACNILQELRDTMVTDDYIPIPFACQG
jgi:hypothetical protein